MFETAFKYFFFLPSLLLGADTKQVNFQLLHTLPLGKNRIISVAFHPDGKTFVTGDEYGKILVYDSSTGKEIREFSGPSTILSLHFFDGGKKLISGEDDHSALPGTNGGIICIRHYPTGQVIDTFKDARRGIVAVSANEKLMAYPTKDGFCLVPLPTMNKKTSFKTSSERPSLMALSPQGELLALGFHGSDNEHIQVFETEQGQKVGTFSGKWLHSVYFETKDSMIVSEEKFIRWNLKEGTKETLYDKHGKIIAKCPRTEFLAFTTGTGYVILFDPLVKKVVGSFRMQTLPITRLAFSEDGSLVISTTAYWTRFISHEAPRVWKRVDK